MPPLGNVILLCPVRGSITAGRLLLLALSIAWESIYAWRRGRSPIGPTTSALREKGPGAHWPNRAAKSADRHCGSVRDCTRVRTDRRCGLPGLFSLSGFCPWLYRRSADRRRSPLWGVLRLRSELFLPTTGHVLRTRYGLLLAQAKSLGLGRSILRHPPAASLLLRRIASCEIRRPDDHPGNRVLGAKAGDVTVARLIAALRDARQVVSPVWNS